MNIFIYERNGNLKYTYELIDDNLCKTIGMLSKVILKDGSIIEGYSDPYRVSSRNRDEFDNKIHDYIYIWRLKNLNEETHEYDIKDDIEYEKVFISDIKEIHSILYSNPRWGGKLTNKYYL